MVLVSCMPVATLGFGAALTHLLRPAPADVGTGQPRTGTPGTGPAAAGRRQGSVLAQPSTSSPAGTGSALAGPATRTGHAAGTGAGDAGRRVCGAAGDRVLHRQQGLLASRGDSGARRDEIVAATGRPESSVKRWLRILRDHELIIAQGATSAARYYLPDHAPDAGTDTSAEGDDAA